MQDSWEAVAAWSAKRRREILGVDCMPQELGALLGHQRRVFELPPNW